MPFTACPTASTRSSPCEISWATRTLLLRQSGAGQILVAGASHPGLRAERQTGASGGLGRVRTREAASRSGSCERRDRAQALPTCKRLHLSLRQIGHPDVRCQMSLLERFAIACTVTTTGITGPSWLFF